MHPLSAARCAVLALASFATAQRSAPPGTVVKEPLGAACDAQVEAVAPNFWGAVGIGLGGQVVLAKGYGMADRQKAGNGPRSVFDVGGISQLFTAALVLQLVDDKKLKRTDPVAKYLPAFVGDKAPITVDMLLLHTSGLPGDVTWLGPAAVNAKAAAESIAKAKLVGAPGGTARASSINVVALALVAEAATGQRIDKLLVDKVLKPAGADGAGACTGKFDSRWVTHRRSGSDARGVPAVQFDWGYMHRGPRGVLASLDDQNTLVGNWLAGKGLGAEARAFVTRPYDGGDALRVAKVPFGTGEALRIAAQTHGYRTRWLLDETSHSWIVLCTDDATDTTALEAALAKQLLAAVPASAATASAPPAPAAAPTVPPPAPAGPPADAARFAGRFAFPRGVAHWRIEADAEGVWLLAEGQEAAVRLQHGTWPGPDAADFERALDRGLAWLERCAAGEAGAAAAAFAEASLATSTLAWFAAQGGPLRQAELLGSMRVDGVLHSWFRLTFAGDPVVVKVVWRGVDCWTAFAVDRGPSPFRVRLTAAGPDRAVAKAWSGGGLDLTMEGPPGRRVLVVGDQLPGGAGLVECGEVHASGH